MSFAVAILAGGLATRLQPVTEKIPKSLIDVAGRPFVVRQIELLRKNGLERVVLCVGHLGQEIERLLGDGRQLGVEIEYSFDGPALRGTGGALENALPLLGDSFFVLYGDSYLQVDYQAIAAAFVRSGKLGLMAVFRNRGQWDRSNVVYREGKMVSYDKRNPAPDADYIDYGVGLLKREALISIPRDKPKDLSDVYRDLLTRGELAGFEVFQRFYEIGSTAGLEETRAYFSSRV